MKHRSFILVLLLVSVCLFPAKGKPRVGVLDFTARSVSADESLSVSDLFRGELVTSGRFEVLDRNNMKNILKEQQFQQTGCTESACAVQIGRLLNMEFMIYGSVLRLGDSYFIQAEVVNIETARIVLTAKEKFFSMGNVDDAIRRVVDSLGGRLTTEREEPQRKDAGKNETKIDAARPAAQTARPEKQEPRIESRWTTGKFWTFIGGLSALAAGGGCNAVGFITLGNANNYYNSTYLATAGVTSSEVATRYTTYSGMVTTGDILNISAYSLYGVGVGLLVWSLFFMPDEPVKKAYAVPMVDIAMSPAGGIDMRISCAMRW